MHMIQFINKYLGWRNWAVINYNSIFENLFIIYYIALRCEDFSNLYILDILVFLLFSIFSTTYGYLINDFADVKLDKTHGKSNTFSEDSKIKSISVIILFLILSIISGYNFVGNNTFLILWITWILLSTFYSLPPVRLKEKGVTGLVFVVFAQRLLPILLVFSAFSFTLFTEIILLSTYVFLRGLSSDINHQLNDIKYDTQTNTKTFAVKIGKKRVESIFRFCLELEKVLLFLILNYFLYVLVDLPYIPYIFLLGVIIIYDTMYITSIYKVSKTNDLDINPFKPSGSNIFQFLHHSYPSVILALTLNLVLIYYNWHYLFLFIGFGLLKGVFSIKVIKNNFIFQFFFKNIIKRKA